jgi:hypothetical protein
VAGELVDPARDLEAKRGRQRGLGVGPAHGELAAVGDRERIEPVEHADQIELDLIEHVAQLERLAGVLDVLGGRAVVDELRGVVAGGALERAEQRHQRVAGRGDPGADRGEVEPVDPGGARDQVRGLARDHLELGLAQRERDLDVEPALQPAHVAEDPPALRGRVAAAVERRIDHAAALVAARSGGVVVMGRCRGHPGLSWPGPRCCGSRGRAAPRSRGRRA